MKPFRPMLAVDFDEKRLKFPYYATPKLDGIRCVVLDGQAWTRSMKPFPNEFVREWFKAFARQLDRFDGELIVGEPTAPNCYSATNSALMTHKWQPNFQFFVFDVVDGTGRPFTERMKEAQDRLGKGMSFNGRVGWLGASLARDIAEMRFYEEKLLENGHEGVMLRSPGSHYKQGRATLGENSLLKVKRFRDAEAVIVGCEERYHNANEARLSELGLTKRSTHKANMIGTDTLGALMVQGAPGQPFAGVPFSIGTGLDDEARRTLWSIRDLLPGKLVKYRYFEVGVKDAPRFPVYQGLREEIDR